GHEARLAGDRRPDRGRSVRAVNRREGGAALASCPSAPRPTGPAPVLNRDPGPHLGPDLGPDLQQGRRRAGTISFAGRLAPMLTTKMNPRVFWGASAIAGGLLLLALMAPATSDLLFGRAQAWVIDTFGWFYVASVAGFLLFVTVVAVGPTGRLKLGPDDAEPD